MNLACSLLGSHVARGAHDLAGLSLATFLIESLRQSKVADLRSTVSRQQHVGWLQVPVYDLLLVRCLDCSRRISAMWAASTAGNGVPPSFWLNVPPSTYSSE